MNGKPPLGREFAREKPLTLSGLAGSNLPTNLHQSALLPVGPASHTGIETDPTTHQVRKADRKSLRDRKSITVPTKSSTVLQFDCAYTLHTTINAVTREYKPHDSRRLAPNIYKHRCSDRRPERYKHATSHLPPWGKEENGEL